MQKRITVSLIIVMLIASIVNLNIFAADVSLSNSNITLNVGETTTVTINGSGVAGTISASSSNGSVASVTGISSSWIEDNSVTVSIKANGVGSTTITIGGKVANLNNSQDESSISKSVTITVKEKEQPQQNNTTTTTKQTTTNNTVSNNNTSNSQSSNNYLKTLEVSEEGLTPDFNKNKTSYSLSVGTKVTKIDVNAIAEDSSAKVSVSGNTELKDGDNNIYITVTAANGTKRTYTIVVNRSDDPEKSNSYLQNLIIRDMKLTPDFASETFEYDGGTIKTNDDKLDIYAYPTNENAKVEIIGNENLKNGENTVKIKITSEDETSTKEYVIKFMKEDGEEISALGEVEEENLTPKQEIKKIFKEIWQAIKANGLLLLMYLLVLVEFVQILYLYKKLKQKEMPNDEEQEEDKKEFDKYNISLDEAKYNENATNILKELDEKEMLNEPKDELAQNIEENTEHEIPQEVEEKIGDTVEELPKVEEEVIERKVRTIWDEERPNFLEGLEEEEEVEDKPKRRRGGRKGND